MAESRAAIEDHLQAWATWYTRLREMRAGVIRFASWEEEERAGVEAWSRWDQTCCWLEAHGIADENIVYDEHAKSAILIGGCFVEKEAENV